MKRVKTAQTLLDIESAMTRNVSLRNRIKIQKKKKKKWKLGKKKNIQDKLIKSIIPKTKRERKKKKKNKGQGINFKNPHELDEDMSFQITKNL